MSSSPRASRARGASFESQFTDWLRRFLGADVIVERLRLSGAQDEGDVYARYPDGQVDLLELKAPGPQGRINLAGWLAEAELEAAHYAKRRGIGPDQVTPVLVIKARGKPLRDAYVVQRAGLFFDID